MADASLTTPAYTLLVREIEAAGDARTRETTDRILGQCVDLIWNMYADKAVLHPRLQYWYAARQVVDFWLKSVWRDVTYDEEVKEALTDQSKNLQAIRENAQEEIERIEKQLAGGGAAAYAIGQLETTSALPARTGRPEPSAPRYGGDARYPLGWRRRPSYDDCD